MKNILITPSFKDDFERCKRLVKSVNQYVSGCDTHYLIIDQNEMELFSELASDKVKLIEKESLLPFRKLPGSILRKWWFGKGSLPVRGWIFQQLCKLAIAESIECDAIVFADSDVEFIRNCDLNDLWKDGKLRLSVRKRGPVMKTDKRYINWFQLSSDLFGLGDQSKIQHGYIAQLNAFRRDTCLEMLNGISEKYGKPWYKVLGRKLDLSEFIIYGAYAEYKKECEGHWIDEENLAHSSWFYEINSDADIKKYLEDLDPHHVAVHVQSNLGFSPSQYQDWIEEITAK